jgi:hypothetical protein
MAEDAWPVFPLLQGDAAQEHEEGFVDVEVRPAHLALEKESMGREEVGVAGGDGMGDAEFALPEVIAAPRSR